MTAKVSVRYGKAFLQTQKERGDSFTKTNLVLHAFATQAYVLALAKTGFAYGSMIRVGAPEGSESVTLWSPRSNIVCVQHCPDIALLMKAESDANRVVVEFDTKHNETMLTMRVFFLPSGKNNAPLFGVFALVNRFGVDILRLMDDGELARHSQG